MCPQADDPGRQARPGREEVPPGDDPRAADRVRLARLLGRLLARDWIRDRRDGPAGLPGGREPDGDRESRAELDGHRG